MAGSIIENMSSRKLGYILAGASVILLLCFLLGALVSPTQTASMQYLATKVCSTYIFLYTCIYLIYTTERISPKNLFDISF